MTPGTAVFLTATSISTEVGMAFPSGIYANYESGGPQALTPQKSLVPPPQTNAASSTQNAATSKSRPAPASGSTKGDAPPAAIDTPASIQIPVAESASDSSIPVVNPITSKLPTVIMPVPSAFTDAQGNVISSTALAAAVPLPAQASPPHAQLPQGAQVNPASPNFPAGTGSPALTLGSQAITANAKSQYIIGSQTLTPGGEITVSGTPVSLAPGGSLAVVGGSTQVLNSQFTPAVGLPPTLTLGAEAFTANAQGQYIVGSQTLKPGGVITVSGTQISLDAGGVYAVVGTSTQTLAPTPQPALTVGTETNTPNAQGQYIIGSQTLTAGGIITVSGTPISLAPGAGYAVVGTSTQYLAGALHAPLTVGSRTITPNAQDQYIIGSQTLTPGGAVTVSGTPISLALGGAYAVVGSSTKILALTTPPPLTLGSQAITANSQGQYVIDGQTLSPGSAITISGTPISLAANDAYAVIGTSTELLAGTITSPPTLTIGAQTVTANAQGQYIIDGQTLTPGGVVTVSGTRISLGADETDVVIGTSTEGLGGYIIGGFGGSGGNNSTGVLGFTGGAEKVRGSRMLWMEGALMAIAIMVVMCL